MSDAELIKKYIRENHMDYKLTPQQMSELEKALIKTVGFAFYRLSQTMKEFGAVIGDSFNRLPWYKKLYFKIMMRIKK